MPTRKEIRSKTKVYSWSAKVDFVVQAGAGLKEIGDKTSLLWNETYILRLERRQVHPRMEQAGMSGFRFVIEAEDTACEAEKMGVRLAYALLFLAVEKRWGVWLSWQDTPLPCRVIDRTMSSGAQSQGFATVTKFMAIDEFVSNLEDAFSKYEDVSYRILLSMELYCSAQMESDNRAKLIMLVCALEALAEQKDVKTEISSTIAKLVEVIDDSEIGDESLRDSLKGQIRQLKRESSRRAIKRLLKDHSLLNEFPCVEEAYNARSKIVHEGQRVPELGPLIGHLEKALRKLYHAIVPDN